MLPFTKTKTRLLSSDDYEMVLAPMEKKDEKKQEVKVLRDQPPLAVGRRKSKRGKAKVQMGLQLPPEFQASVTYRHKFFFFCNGSATLQPVTCGDLFLAAGAVCTVANGQVRPIHTSLRIRKVRGWVASSSTVPTQINIEWATAFSSLDPDLEKDRLLPQGITTPSVVAFSPPAKSLAGFWISSNVTMSTVLMTISAPNGSVLEVTLDCVQRNNYTQAAASGTTTTCAVGDLLYGRLDYSQTTPKFYVAGLPECHA